MKNKRTAQIGVAVLIAVSVLLAVGCKDTDPVDQTGATITGIKVAGVAVSPMPEPVGEVEWEEGVGSWTEDQRGRTVTVPALTDSTTVAIEGLSAGAKAAYAKMTTAALPDEDAFHANVADILPLGANNYLYIKVTSGNGRNVNYYRVQVRVASSSIGLQTFTVGPAGSAVTVTDRGSYITTWGDFAAPGSVRLSESTKDNAVITVAASGSGTAAYAVVQDGSTAMPAFTSPAGPFNLDADDVIYVEVTAQNGINKGYYKIVVAITAEPFSVDLSTATVSNNGGSIIDQSATGFTWNKTVGYGGHHVKIPVTFPEGVTIKNFAELEFEYSGVSGGDLNYKNVVWLIGVPATGGALDNLNGHQQQYGPNNENLLVNFPDISAESDPRTLSSALVTTNLDANNGQSVVLGFHVFTEANNQFRIENVKLK